MKAALNATRERRTLCHVPEPREREHGPIERQDRPYHKVS